MNGGFRRLYLQIYVAFLVVGVLALGFSACAFLTFVNPSDDMAASISSWDASGVAVISVGPNQPPECAECPSWERHRSGFVMRIVYPWSVARNYYPGFWPISILRNAPVPPH